MHGEEMQTELRLPRRNEKGGAGILDRGRAVGAAQKDQAAVDELFYRNLTLQLSNYCYVCVAGLTEEEKQGVFACCCLLYQKNAGIMKQNMRRLQSDSAPGADDLGVWTVEAAGKVVSVDCIISRDGKDRKD